MNRRFKEKRSGQTALIVLLIMVVILTIGLSLASRSITDIRISQDEKEAVRAFSAAEAGIEDILSQSSITLGSSLIDIGSDLQASVNVSAVNERSVEKGEVFTIDLGLDGVTQGLHSLTIFWTKDDTIENQGGCTANGPAALEIVVYQDDYSFTRYAYNGYDCSVDNNFGASLDSSNDAFRSEASINIDTDGDKLIRIKPFYRQATIRVDTDRSSLGTQIYNIASKVEGEGKKTAKIIVSRTISVLPPIFDYVLFSGGNLTN